MTEFKVGDKVRHKAHPRLAGDAVGVRNGFVYFQWDGDGDTNLAFPLDEVEHIGVTEEVVGFVEEDERISAWHEIASHLFFRDAYSDGDRLLPAMLKRLDSLVYAVGTPQAEIEPGESEWVPPVSMPTVEGLTVTTSPVPTEHDKLVSAMQELLQSWLETFDKKQKAYGSQAIANAPLGALQGLLNRVHDKYSRWVQLTNNPDVDDLGEAVKDTIQDLGIYCAMAVLVSEGKWPGA